MVKKLARDYMRDGQLSARGIALQKRWRFCQGFATELYHSDLSLEVLQSVAANIATAMRAREDAILEGADVTGDIEDIID